MPLCNGADRSCNITLLRKQADFQLVVVGANGDGLDEAMLPDRFGKLLQLGWLKGLTGVSRRLENGVDRQNLEFTTFLHDALLGGLRVLGGGAHTLPCIRSVGEELGLGVRLALPFEGFDKALVAKVSVPQPSETLMLRMELGVADVLVFGEEARPLLDTDVVVAVVLCEAPDYVKWRLVT